MGAGGTLGGATGTGAGGGWKIGENPEGAGAAEGVAYNGFGGTHPSVVAALKSVSVYRVGSSDCTVFMIFIPVIPSSDVARPPLKYT